MDKNFENLRPKEMSSEKYFAMSEQAHSAHFNDDFDLYVSSYFEGNRQLGICVSSNEEENIDNFVKYWVEQGYLKEIKKGGLI